jgi:hypothetical protein
MGFPEWTLWGMGISGLGALLMIGLALLAQSPATLARMRLLGSRLDLRARAFTGYGFALLLLAFGFFFAGVPIGPVGEGAVNNSTPLAQATEPTTAGAAEETAAVVTDSLSIETPTPRATVSTAGSGSFGAPPANITGTVAAEVAPPTEAGATTVSTAAPTDTPLATNTATATPSHTPTSTASPTPTPTSTPTTTPTPTVTPTPIEGETAVISTQGNPVSVRRAPGSQQILAQLQNGTVVVVQSGRANQGGLLWREIRTVEGVLGWVPEEFLALEE